MYKILKKKLICKKLKYKKIFYINIFIKKKKKKKKKGAPGTVSKIIINDINIYILRFDRISINIKYFNNNNNKGISWFVI